jgi:PAS domain S-box-containing protein
VNIKLVVFLTLLLGSGLLVWQARDFDSMRKANLIEHVKIISSAVNVDRIATLHANETDLQNIDYLRLKEQLTDIADSMTDVRYVYLMARVNNQIVILVDTQPTELGTDGLAIPGEVYQEASLVLTGLLDKNETAVEGPETDKWGTFFSAMTSIVDKSNGKVVAMAGIDVDTKTWNIGLILNLLPWFVTIMFLILVEIVVDRNLKKNTRDAQKMAYLASVLESSDDAIYSIDFDKKILSWNLGAERLYGYTAQEVLGKDMTGLLLPEGGVSTLDEKLKLLATGKRMGHQDTVRKTKLGNLINVSLILSPVFDEFGRVTSVSAIARDITKQKQLDESLEKHNAELEKMNRLMIDREIAMMELKKKLKRYEIVEQFEF